MTELLTLTEAQRRNVFNQAVTLAGLSPKVVEKDWWVTLTLKAIFQTEYREHLLFKGGTSLSKCWHLINRFSEDVDLAVDRDWLGFGGELNRNQIHNLKKAACTFTTTLLRPAIEAQLLALGVPAGILTVSAKPVPPTHPDTDPQELTIIYPSLYDTVEYIPDIVRIEVSGRSLIEPWSNCTIQSFVSEFIPGEFYSGAPFEVRAVDPGRTFLEKIFLLHEEFQKTANIRHLRMSRHLYDIVKLMDIIHGWTAIGNNMLYESITVHRGKYNKISGVNYQTHARTTIIFIPPPAMRDLYQADYAVMREQMIQEEAPPSFSELITNLEELIERLRNPIELNGKTLENIVIDAQAYDPWDQMVNSRIEGAKIEIPVTYSPTERYVVEFTRENKIMIFRSIKKL
jgi:hypothetical protein